MCSQWLYSRVHSIINICFEYDFCTVESNTNISTYDNVDVDIVSYLFQDTGNFQGCLYTWPHQGKVSRDIRLRPGLVVTGRHSSRSCWCKLFLLHKDSNCIHLHLQGWYAASDTHDMIRNYGNLNQFLVKMQNAPFSVSVLSVVHNLVLSYYVIPFIFQ